MKVAQIQFSSWNKIYNFDLGDFALIIDDSVVVKTEVGTEIGKVVGFKELDDNEINKLGEIKPILRKATASDLEKVYDEKQKKEALGYCKKVVDKLELSMKLVDVNSSFDGASLTFAFIADGRVDFRELVKDLTRHFKRSIRLQQIGIRDEAKVYGDYGHCGKPLCCKRFLKDLSSITSDMAEVQQIAHRGSERISGICGRLMCCLAYEQCGYKESAEKLPKIGTKVDVDGKKGVIIGHHVLKQSVDVEFPPENGDKGRNIVEVDLNRNKKQYLS